MKDFNQIQKEIESSFETYFSSLLNIKGIPRKYFYWNSDFLVNEDNLKFEFFDLEVAIKDNLNTLGKEYFNRIDVYFYVNRNSHRHDLTLNNFVKIFNESNKKDQTLRYEYIKEYIFWQLLITLEENYQEDFVKLTKEHSLKQDDNSAYQINQVEKYRVSLKQAISIQKRNFLITYVNYSTQTGKQFRNPKYVHFSSLTQFSEINVKIKLIDDISESNKNNELIQKINSLYIHKDYKEKIHFVFSIQGGAQKEELRELLEIMSDFDNAEFYRGQAEASWILDASIKRESNFLKYESEMYYDILSLKPEAFKGDHSVYDRLITMQHFGMPTRLLDVSRNPLIAIFFACNNLERAKSDGLIYAFKPDETVKLLHFEDKKLNVLESFYKKEVTDSEFLKGISFLKGVAKNQRINNQSGDFIFAGDGEDVLEKLNDLPKKHIVIDSNAKKPLLEQLESMNIHAGSVYPDLTNVSKYISEKYKRMTEFKKTSISHTSEVEKLELSKDFSIDLSIEDFWSEDRLNRFINMVNEYSLNENETKEQINHFIDFVEFQDFKLINLLKNKPSLNERETTRENLKSLLLDFMKE
ncbi:FRG domain-containing protein [Algoriphagus ratkowskyi]|uniref:FRG domain-containing protein n=1 Tax=Algoriphagus ratkowskyi TaxID=57028 RepID=A0A2W7RQE7_9BACT|nr:FRG domain-containing protein [Algoriphagus ratkowskyi]PZX57597.1 FRG domain-containing protein [Algoriphagus ratkowskyi]TXD78872.1 FRG domain-containing protein [Algoriphagus ratkowskyi]